MNGFLMTRQKVSTLLSEVVKTNNDYFVGDYIYHIEASNCFIETFSNGDVIIIDGYIFPDNNQAIVDALVNDNIDALSALEGHFSGILITEKYVTGFNDRYGGKTLFWQALNEKLFISSCSALMPIFDLEPNQDAISETIDFRWTSGENTLLESIKKLKVRHIVTFTDSYNAQQKAYWHLPLPKYDSVSDSEKIELTKQSLIGCLEKAQKRYKKVAVFLSGGVDSSILAALSKDVFEECYLITPIFKGEENPELENAKAFAKVLNLPLNFVEIVPSQLKADLEVLLSLKREPLRHYSSLAMMAMMRAIPDGYDAVVYGEAADTLFGSNAINRIVTHSRWKKQTSYIPKVILNLFKKVIPGRISILLKLKKTSLKEIVLSTMKIKYSEKERDFLKQLTTYSSIITSWLWDEKVGKSDGAMMRHVAQERVLTCDAATHFYEAEIIAQLFNKHIISPFFTPEAIDVASTLSDQQYFGDSYVKPILRELACEFFSRELIYQKKLGFPVPFIAWLQGPLSDLISEVQKETELFDGKKLKTLDINEHYELYWLIINWKICNQQFKQKLGVYS